MPMVYIYDFSYGVTYPAPTDDYIIDTAEKFGLHYPYSDRAGASPSSLAYLYSGRVDNSDQSYLDEETLAAGFFLTDTAYPLTNLVISTDPDSVWQLYEAFDKDRFHWARPVIM